MTLYQQLGVEQTATSEEIKRAYYRQVRQFTPENNPDVFMRIRKAYEELSDQGTRKAYDATLARFDDISGEVTAIIMEAERLSGKGLTADAIRLLEMELNGHKEGSAAANAMRYALCKIYIVIKKSGKAVDIAEKLVRQDPENTEYLRLAVIACQARGWTNRANDYRDDLRRIDPGNELDILMDMDDDFIPPYFRGVEVEKAEYYGKKAPLLCARILSSCLDLDNDDKSMLKYLQMSLADVVGKDYLPWDDPLFIANKLAEHSEGLPDYKRKEMRLYLEKDILPCMYRYDRYDILPKIDIAIENAGAEDIFSTPLYKTVSAGHTALSAVLAGIPKMLVAFSVMRAYIQSDYCSDLDKPGFRDEALAFELDILMDYRLIKKDISRFRDEFKTLYQYSADFFDTISHYNDNKIYDEANSRISKLKHKETRFSFDWLGEDDDFGPVGESGDGMLFQRNEPVRVTKIGRNEPCPCGSGLKYKKCCGR